MKRIITTVSFVFFIFLKVVAQPTITAVSVAAGNYKIGDNIILTVTTTGTAPTGIKGTSLVNGVLPTTFAGSGPYTIVYHVGAGNTDRASVGAIPISIIFTSGSGDSNTYTTAPTSGGTVTIDANAPAQPGAPDMTASTDTGISSTDNLTKDNTPDFTGSGTTGNTIKITSSVDGVVGTGTVSGGTYTITVSTLSEGAHNITVIETDPAGNPSIASSALAITIDTTPPGTAPTVPDLQAASDSGSSSTDDNTNDNTPTFDVTGSNTLLLEILDGATVVASVTGTGAVQALTASTLTDGVKSITARTSDAAGNSVSSAALSVTIDTTPPATPPAPDLVAGSDSGSSSTDNITNDNTPDFSVTGTTGLLLELLRGGSTVIASTASATGAAQTLTSTSLSDGSYSITARSTDVAGNTATSAALNPVVIDTAAPAQPAAPDLTAGTDLGISSTDNLTSDNTPDFTGSGTNGSTITVTSSVNGVVGTGTVSGGTYTITVSSLSEGAHNMTVIETDLAGNPSIASSALAITIDTTPPGTAPTVPDLQAASDSGSSSTDDNTNDNTPTFDVTGTNGLLLEILDGATVVASLTGTGAVQALTASTLTDGVKSITARTSDAAGNSISSAALSVTIDTTPPATPPAPDLVAGSDSGSSSTDNITNDNTPDFSVTGTTGLLLEILRGGSTVIASTASATGAAQTLTSTSLSDGSYSITARSTDVAGNTATSAALNPVVIDTAAPAAPGTPDLTSGTDAGVSNSDDITNNLSPSFTVGSVISGNTINIFSSVDGGSRGSAVAAGASVTVPTTLVTQANNQTHSITATQTDPAGNASPSSAGLTITLDATAPTILSASFSTSFDPAADPSFTVCSATPIANTSPSEIIHLTMSEPLGLANGALVSVGTPGFAASAGTFDTSCDDRGATVYHNTNIIHLKSGANNNWDGNTTFSFNTGGSNVKDVAGNELGAVATITPGDSQPPALATGLVFSPNGAAPETIVFQLDETLNAAVASTVTGFTTSTGTIAGGANYNSGTRTVTLTSTADGQWTDAVTLAYSQATGNVTDPANNELLAFAAEPIFLTSVHIQSNNALNTALATTGNTITLTFNAARVLASTPVVTIGGLSATVTGGPVSYSASVVTTIAVPETPVAFQINVAEAIKTTTVSVTTDGSSVTFDKTPPATPTAPDLAAASDSGTNTDNITNINAGLVFQGANGTAENNALVQIFDNVTLLGTATATGTGSWTYTHVGALSDGVHPINIKARDAAGNVSSASANLNVTVDTTPPVVASIALGSTLKGIGTTNGIFASSVDFLVTFTEANTTVNGVDNTDFTIISDGTVSYSALTAGSVTGSGNTRTVTISGISGNGRISLGLTDNNSIVDVAANPLAGAGNGSVSPAYTGSQYYTIVLPQPGAQAFNTPLTAGTITSSTIDLTWKDNNANTPLPTHYLLMAKPTTGGSYPSVADGTYVPDAPPLIQNVVRAGANGSYTFTGLSSGTSYDFIIYKYSLALPPNGSLDNIDFELTSASSLNGIVTNTAAKSWALFNSAATSISSIKDNTLPTDKADVMQFTIYDDGLDPISPNVMNFNDNGTAPETVTFTLRYQLTNGVGALLSGFSASSTGVIPNANAVYSGPTTNIITLTSPADGAWTSATTISYSATTGNAQFVTLGKMQSIANHTVSATTPTTVTYSAVGLSNFTVPAGVTSITAEVWGGGGSGGPFLTNYNFGSSSGGGGGAYSRSFLTVTPGTVYTTSVGAGGPGYLGGIPYVVPGNAGSPSYFGSTSLVYAVGGFGGWNSDYTDYYSTAVLGFSTCPTCSFGGPAASGVGDEKRSGGNGGIGYGHGGASHNLPGVYGYGGGGGSSAGPGFDGVSGANGVQCCVTSPGGNAPSGGGDGGIGTLNQPGFSGLFPGGGGGGTSGLGPFMSGAGADGQVKVTYYLPASSGATDWAGDNSPFKFSDLVITQGTGNAVSNWKTVIAGAELFDGTNSVVGTVNNTNITFSGLTPTGGNADVGVVPDANGALSFKNYTLRVWLRTDIANALAGTLDGTNLAFALDLTNPANLTYDDATNSAQKSSRLTSPAPSMTSGVEPIDVVASKLVYKTPGATPIITDVQSQIGVKIPFSASSAQDPEVYALDRNNNLDLNYSNSATISNTTAFGQSTNSISFSAGKLLLNPFFFTTGAVTPTNTQIIVTGSGAPTVTPAQSSNIAPIISSATTISAAAGGEPGTLSSLTTALTGAIGPQVNAISNLNFTVTDDVSVNSSTFVDNDGLPTLINQIIIKQGTGNDAVLVDWSKAIAGAELTLTLRNGSAAGLPLTVTTPANVVINPTTISFNNIAFSTTSSPGYLADGTANVYTLKIYLKNPIDPTIQDQIDGKDFVFEIAKTSTDPNISIDPTNSASSTFVTSSSTDSGNGNNTVAVLATKLNFTTQWASNADQNYDSPLDSDPGVPFLSPVAKAQDINGNLDLDWATAASVTTTAPLAHPLANQTVAVTSGVLTFNSGLKVTSAGGGLNNDTDQLIVSSTGLTNGTSLPFKLKYSGNSDIIDAGFTQPQNIQYALANNQVTDITNATGIAVEQFTVRDGGGSADTDGTATKLSSITLNIDNYQYLRRVALYDGSTEVADLPVAAPNITINSATNADMTFTGITNFIVTDDLTKDLTVKVSFNASNVLDNAVIQFKVVSVTAGGVSSSFTAGASTAFPTLALYENQIEVIATQIDYTTIPANASVYVPITVVAEARDANANRDLDYNGTISSFSTTPGGPTFTTDTPNDPTGAFANGIKNFPVGFQFLAGQGNTQLVLNSGAGSTAGSVNSAAISGTSAVINVLTSSESWVTTQPTYNLPTDINYISYQATNITNSNSAELVQLILSDGDADGTAGDIDGAATVLNSITIGIANHTAIRRIAIYDNNDVEIQELDASNFVSVGPGPNGPIGSITFGPSLGITAADNNFKLFRIRATFFNTPSVIVDNTPIQLSFIGGTLGGGSKFYDVPPSSGTYILGNPPANVTAPATANKIEVTATALDFTTQGSTYAGINEPVGPGHTTSPLPAFTQQPTPSALPTTTAATVQARDANQLVDLDFNITASAITITDNAGDNIAAPNAFINGVLSLDGLVYNMVGDGTLKVKANGLDSSLPSTGHVAGGLVNVVNVSVNPAAIVTPPNLKGGTPGAILLGVTFKPDYSTTTEPSLKKFIFSFDYPYQTATTTILKNFKVRQGATDVTTTGATVTPYYSNPSVTTDLDLVIVDWGSNTPVPLYDPNTGNPLAVTFYLIADIDITAKIGTQKLTPQLIDGGNGRPTDGNIITTVGTASAGVIGQQYSFASTRPPVLKTNSLSLTRPYNGQLNVDKTLNHIDLEFDVQVWSLDGAAELYDRTTNIKVADLVATNGNFVTQGGTSTPTANPISFSINWLNGNSFQDDGLYYVTIEKGSFDNLSGTGTGISDDGFNYFGGISSNSILFFKVSSPNPPVLSGASGVFSNLSTGVFKTIFDQRGTAYYLVLNHAQYIANGSNKPTNADILTPSAYSLANPGSVVTNGNYAISQVNTAQTESFNGALSASTTYDVWVFAKNDAAPTNISTAAPYGSSANNFSVGGVGPTLQFTTPTISNIRNSFQPDYTLCPNSFVTLTDPIIIGEQTSTDFQGIGLQDFNILLPTGFEFDGVNKPNVQLVGAEFDQTSLLVSWINNTLINVAYRNNPSFNSGISTLDKIIITNLRIIGNGGSDPGNIRRFAGNASIGSSANLASISNLSTSQQKFTNSYSISNDFTPFGFSSGATITAIPDNYIDADPAIPGAIRLIPQITPANDFGITFFSGNGVTNDVLSLSAVALNSAFDITMTHTDLNGCISENNVQYVVYDHNAPISTKLGSAPIPGSNPPVAGGTQEALVNSNFPAQAATVVYPNASLPRINYKDLAGYKLLLLKADLPSNSANQIMTGSPWQTQISKIPVIVNSVTNDTDLPTVLGFTAYNEYQWDYTHVLNAVSESSSAIAVDPYDNFKFYTSAAKTNTYWTGGSLGKVVFTGTFQNTADLSVLVPFRQEVELFVPPIPAIEVSASPSFDLADPLNPISSAPNGTPVFCEQGGDISIFGFPTASASSSGVFTLFDAQSNTSVTIPAGSFTDNGNGTALLKPNLLNNSYRDIKIVYTYKENNSPSTGSSSFIIRVSPNPVANFTTSLLCEDIDVKFTDTSTLTAASGVTINSWKWGFSDNNSPNNSDVAQNPIHKYNDAGLYPGASLTVATNYNCSSVVPKLIDLNIGGTPTVAFGLTGVSIADTFSFTSTSTSSSNDNLAKLDWTFGNGNILAVSSGFGATVTNGYANPGPYNVDLKVTSQIGCTNNLTKQIVVLDRATPSQTSAYLETFESSNGNWQVLKSPTSPSPASWAYGVPTTNVIKIDPAINGSKVWKTGLSGTYNDKEVSAIYSPSFDLSQLQRPMISFNTFTQMESSDGVVLEYSVDNKNIADPTKTWDALGALGDGVDWFTDQGIAAKPGNQPSKDYGWSSIVNNVWKESKHAINDVPNKAALVKKSVVVFRLALASAKVSPSFDGFAFDNVRIGERTRTILLENFTTTNGTDNTLVKTEADTVTLFQKNGLGTTVVKLNYHVGFTSVDPFNLDNPADPSARALYYNVKQVPFAFLDGARPTDVGPGQFSTWGLKAYNSQTLQLAQSQINVSTPIVGADGSIKFDIKVNALYDLPDNTILNVAMIEQSIDGSKLSQAQRDLIKTGETSFNFVLKKMLPNAAGTKFGTLLPKGTSRTFSGFEYNPDPSKLYDAKDDLAIIVFLQNESGRGIYQTELITGFNDPPVVTGLENVELLERVEVYPNPSDKEFIIQLPGVAKQAMEIQLIDQVGKMVIKDSLAEGASRKTVGTQDFAAGVYILQIGSGKSVVRKKILVVHQD